jgi:thiamine-monophosphate kinase
MRRLSEDAVIREMSRRLARDPSVRVPLGDDAAAVRVSPKRMLVATTDHMAEGVHFERRLCPPRLLGRKLVRTNLSDMSAMGAAPRWALVNAALSGDLAFSWVQELVRGVRQEARRHGLVLLGGDTTASRKGIFLSLTLLGEADPHRCLRRTGAGPGALVFVSGTLGASAAGLRALRRSGGYGRLRGIRRRLAERHLLPPVRLALARALAKENLASAAMDLSDGLSVDLARFCAANRAGAVLRESSVPVDPAVRRAFPKDALSLALHGGEDYELLFAASARKRREVLALGKKCKIRLTEIGKLARAEGILLAGEDGRKRPLSSRKGFRHFSER